MLLRQHAKFFLSFLLEQDLLFDGLASRQLLLGVLAEGLLAVILFVLSKVAPPIFVPLPLKLLFELFDFLAGEIGDSRPFFIVGLHELYLIAAR
mmetsp:Transcript_851/g.1288  ORF Transcript_851/g.1288 Transcript_851/m.1288 type:complete len:94 (-) Transcript_851:1894-2175(-)